VLQLYKTPWLPDIPSSQNIFFIETGNLLYFEKAFIMADLNRPNDKSNPFLSRNPTLLALAVLLVEFLRGHTVDDLRTPEEVLCADMRPLANCMIARRLLSEVSQTSSTYGSAVRRCIDGEFRREHLNLDDEDFRHEVYSGVVALLEEDLKKS
jgi:hypothetical protein